jgi:aminopeptidase N
MEYTADPDFAKHLMLYKTEAEKREKLVSNVSYQLLISFLKDADTSVDGSRGKAFYGHVTVKFDLEKSFKTANSEDLFLDYFGYGVKNIKLNGKHMSSGIYFHHQRIYFDPSLLKIGDTNVLSVSFKSKYRNDGEGPHLFKDSEDSSEYIYTQFESFYANRAFPCFDQPDIKATLKFRAIVPESWTVIANGKDISMLKQGDKKLIKYLNSVDAFLVTFAEEPYKLIEFAETKKISTYLYAFAAGQFDYFEREMNIKGLSKPLRMRLYFRKSVKEDVDRIQDLMFTPVATAMGWYTEYFGHEFPFDKFDQIYCPEFKYGAMENVGAVTYTEALLFRGAELTEDKKTSIINTALHELAHMWFGNLVTMHWWNDLWLNEAFATFISYYAMSEIESIRKMVPSLWIQVNRFKHRGYHEDEISTTHPIYSDAKHTDAAQGLIDGITYGKGCAFLQQLHHLIGPEIFENAIKRYFKKHAWRNTYLEDFIGSLDEAYKLYAGNKPDLNVEEWAKKFLNTKGVNTLEIVEQRNNTAALKQNLGEFSDSLIEQKLNILVFDKNMTTKNYSVMTSDTEFETELPFTLSKNNMYIINDQDKAYTQFYLDSATSKFLSKNLANFDDIMTRNLVWRALVGMVKMRKIKVSLFFEFIHNNLRNERHPVLLKSVLQSAAIATDVYVPDEKYEQVNSDMFELVYEMLLTTTSKINSKSQELGLSAILDILNEIIFGFCISKKFKLPFRR